MIKAFLDSTFLKNLASFFLFSSRKNFVTKFRLCNLDISFLNWFKGKDNDQQISHHMNFYVRFSTILKFINKCIEKMALHHLYLFFQYLIYIIEETFYLFMVRILRICSYLWWYMCLFYIRKNSILIKEYLFSSRMKYLSLCFTISLSI